MNMSEYTKINFFNEPKRKTKKKEIINKETSKKKLIYTEKASFWTCE